MPDHQQCTRIVAGGPLTPEQRSAAGRHLLAEAALLRRAAHPNVLPLLGVVLRAAENGACEAGATPAGEQLPLYLVTPLVEGGSLQDLLAEPLYGMLRLPPLFAGDDGPRGLRAEVVSTVLADVFTALAHLAAMQPAVLV